MIVTYQKIMNLLHMKWNMVNLLHSLEMPWQLDFSPSEVKISGFLKLLYQKVKL